MKMDLRGNLNLVMFHRMVADYYYQMKAHPEHEHFKNFIEKSFKPINTANPSIFENPLAYAIYNSETETQEETYISSGFLNKSENAYENVEVY